jgi:hypothetical protein
VGSGRGWSRRLRFARRLARPSAPRTSLIPGSDGTAGHVDDLSARPPELKLFARIERLGGEEAALLAVPRESRTEEQYERLRAISAELDRVWERLRERAERLARGREAGRAP